jgi:hypothetical protein
MVKKYRKKPVVIEAVQWGGTAQDATPIIDWILENGGTARYVGPDADGFDTALRIDTLEGTMTAKPWDWIIKGVQNEFYPCKPDIFESTYEEYV